MIDEVFGHFIGWKIDKNNVPSPEDYEGGEKYLIWGLKYLNKYYNSRDLNLDDIRQLELDVFKRLLQKGQLDSNGERIDPFIYMI